MALLLWLCAVALVSAASGISTNVPNQCPSEPEEYPTFYVHPDDCQYYFMCNHGTPQLKTCAEGSRWSDVFTTCVEFNSHYDTCTRENAQRECSRGFTGLIPHSQACQRYYNCSNPATPHYLSKLGQYEDECPYSQLFDVVQKKCMPYREAYCGPYRVAAKDPCDYLKNLCGGAHCEPCRSRLPSCVDSADGIHEHFTKLWSPYYIHCQDERLVSIDTCGKHPPTDTSAIFSPIKKACVSRWEIPREHGGLAPSCDGKDPGQSYRTDERPDVYYSCPGPNVFYCGLGNVFNESTQKCESFK